MKKLLFTIFSLFLIQTTLSAQSGVDFSGTIESLWGVGAPWTDSDTSAGRFTLGNTAFTGQLDAYYNNSSAYAEATFSYDSFQGFDLSLGEVWLDYTASFWGIRIGRQKAAWGKADGIDITNVLCPSDMTSLGAMISDDSKLAIDAVRFSITGNQFTADAYWIPFFTPSALPLEEDNSLRKFLVPSTVEFPIPALNQTLILPVSIGELEKPELAIWNGEYGLKLSGYFSMLDLSLYGFYGWDDIPLLEYTPVLNALGMPESITVNGEYKRMAMLGADAALPIGETVLRLETAFFPQRYFQKEEGGSEQKNQLSALAGIDWMPSGWTITAQYYCDYLFGDIESLERSKAYNHGATISISKSLVNETLELSLSALLGLNDFDSMLAPEVKYSLSDQISLAASAYIFIPGPDNDGKYGAYKDLSSFCLSAKFSF